MANPKFEVNFELEPLTVKDEKTGLFSSKFAIFKNASGVGRTKKEAEENLICSFKNMWNRDKDAVISIITQEYFPKDQKPNNIDFIPA